MNTSRLSGWCMGWEIKASETQVLGFVCFLDLKRFIQVSTFGPAFILFRVWILTHCSVFTAIINDLHSMFLILLQDSNTSLHKTGGRYFTSCSVTPYSRNHIIKGTLSNGILHIASSEETTISTWFSEVSLKV